MKKRVLTLLLAVLMIAAAIPLATASNAIAEYTVSFTTKGRGTAPAPIRVIGGKSLKDALNSIDDIDIGSNGFDQFAGWSLKKNGKPADAYDYDAPITENILLYPIWVPAIDNASVRVSASARPAAGDPIPETVEVSVLDAESEYEVTDAYWCTPGGTVATGTFQNNSVYFLRVILAPVGNHLFRDNDGLYDNETLAMRSAVIDTGNGFESAYYITGSRNMAHCFFMYVTGDVILHTVTFNTNDSGYAFPYIMVPHGMTITDLLGCDGRDTFFNNMFEEGKHFLGWKNDEVLGGYLDFDNDPMYGDLELTADWMNASPVELVELYASTPRVGETPKELIDKNAAATEKEGSHAYVADYKIAYERDGKTMDPEEKFVENKIYDLVLVLYADDGYYFAGGRSMYGGRHEGRLNVKINGGDVNYAPVSYGMYEATVRFSFAPVSSSAEGKTISKAEFSVSRPMAYEFGYNSSFRATPKQTTFIPGNVEWYRNNDGKLEEYYGRLIYGDTYIFELTLLAKDGYTFEETVKTAIIEGATMISFSRTSPRTIIVRGEIKPALPFTDVPEGKWYTDAVGFCYSFGLMSGTSASKFSPGSAFTRAMFVTVLAKIDDADTSTYTGTSFTDVPEGKWYSKPIQWAYKNNYAAGLGNGKFGPGNAVTREQMAVFLCNYSEKKGKTISNLADLSGYPDAGKISKYAVTGIQWAVGNGMISGVKSGDTVYLQPKGTATRAQVAVIVKNFIDKFIK